MDLSHAIWTPHALEQVSHRAVSRSQVEAVLRSPSRVDPVREGRVVATSPIEIDGSPYILRVFVDVDRTPPEIVTAYRTSKIDKYGGPR